jgi:AmmeMemoRadiSam system protein B
MTRRAAVAGQFYYAERSRLLEQVENYVDKRANREEAIGVVCPHAGLVYSGPVAGAVYSSLKFPKTFVMLGPNHTGLGSAISLMEESDWETPLGVVGIDRKLAAKVAVNVPAVTRDSRAHLFEHSLEVQLPFISYFSSDVKIVPIALLAAGLEDCRVLGEGVAKAIQGVDYPVVMIASSDMSHYLPDTVARQRDKKAIDRILDLDPKGLYETVRREGITMCGYLPVTVMLFAAKALGAQSARLVKYATSGEVSGDYESVVGYAGVMVR